MDESLVVFASHGPVAVLRLNRERKLNALNREIFDLLQGYLEQIECDETLAVTVLTGTGRAFCAGADIGEYWKQDTSAFVEFQRRGRALNERIETHLKPVIAAVNGFAFGGGFELALACDFIVANENAQFALPEPSLGLVPGGGGTQRLPRIVGKNRAKELLLTGRHLSAQEAYEWGVVSAVTKVGEEITVARSMGEAIAQQVPQSVQALKRLVNEGLDAPLETALSYEQQVLVTLYNSADGQEGIAAFMEKRKPRFSTR